MAKRVFYHGGAPFKKSVRNQMTEERHSPADDSAGEPRSRSRWAIWLRPAFKSAGRASPLQFLPLYYATGILLFLLLRTLAEYLLPAHTPKLWAELFAEAIFAFAAIAPAFAISRVEGRRFGEFGLPGHQAFGKLFWVGVLWGMVFVSFLLLVLRAAGALSYGGLILHGVRVYKFALFWAAFFLLVALFEEFTFRGFSLFAIQQVAGFWPSAFLLSAIFAYIHHSNPGESWTGALGAGAVGLFWCFTLRRTGNLWFAVGMHASWDWAQTFLYGVPDSGVVEPGHLLKASLHGPTWLTGGTVGPEGSALLFVLIAVMWVIFDRMYPARTLASDSPRRHGGTEKL